jgi:hypothetical protein
MSCFFGHGPWIPSPSKIIRYTHAPGMYWTQSYHKCAECGHIGTEGYTFGPFHDDPGIIPSVRDKSRVDSDVLDPI